MTNEELDEARGNEAYELWCRDQPDGTKGYAPVQVAIRAARLARENWTPPEPVVDPDVLAFREWGAADCEADGWTAGATLHRQGHFDISEGAAAFLAGARMAREQEQERAGPLVEYVETDARRLDGVGSRALKALAKHRGRA
jgi:hypothetical protein